MGSTREAAAHVLVIPVDLAGHITPLLRLATQLAQNGVTITLVSYEDVVSRLDGTAELKGLDFRFVGLKRKGGDKTDISRPSKDVYVLGDAFEPYLETLLQDRTGGPTIVLSDMFLHWAQDVAEKLQIPRYMMDTSGVIFAKYMDGILDYFKKGQFQYSEVDGKLVPFDWVVKISGLPPMQYHEMTTSVRNDPDHFRLRSELVGTSAGILVNSFYELEDKVIESWQSEGLTNHKKIPKIYPVGPLFSVSLPVMDPNPENPSTKCLNWLSSQPPSSVLYVAFGSLATLKPEQIVELAHGLEDSQQRFLWVIPQPKEEETFSISEILPPGFHERVGDRGYIMTKWAPQLHILANSATGGFLSHCGWNSTLESIIWGVPLISWPMNSEQPLNCRYLVDVLKIALQLETNREVLVKRTEVVKVVHRLMVEEEGKAIKSRVKSLQRKAQAAVAEGGSSSKFFNEFLNDILLESFLQLKLNS